jgi:hypothetical protein
VAVVLLLAVVVAVPLVVIAAYAVQRDTAADSVVYSATLGY